MISWDGTIAVILGTAALLAAIAYLVRFLVKVGRVGRAVFEIVDRELTHNHGTSIKDDVYGTAVALGKLQREVDQIGSDLYNHLAERTPKTP